MNFRSYKTLLGKLFCSIDMSGCSICKCFFKETGPSNFIEQMEHSSVFLSTEFETELSN